MRPLNRPMFRNGGPIKEGIMSGMQDRPGYSLAGRVGGFFQNVFKKKPVQTGTVVVFHQFHLIHKLHIIRYQ
jgi:hypothetical protein